MTLLSLCQSLNATPVSTGIRESVWLFPILETVHLLGIAASAGTILFVDLRLLGLSMRRERLTEVLEQLQPWTLSAYALMFVTGLLLFLSEPVKCYHSGFFRAKLVMLLLAGLNAAWFHWRVYPTVATWDEKTRAPREARLAGGLSLTLWIGIIAMGRAIAYGN